MSKDADEYEQALALEMGLQRRQWDKVAKLEKQVGEQAARMREVELQLQEQAARQQAMEGQVECHGQAARTAQAGLVERCDEERDARQEELSGLRASIKALGGTFDDTLCSAVQDLTRCHQKSQQDLAQDLGSKCQDLERFLAEELRSSAADLERKSREMVHECTSECTELIRGCTERSADLDRAAAEERDSHQQELRKLRASVKATEDRFDDMLHEAMRDIINSQQRGLKELRSSCDAVQRQHEDLMQDFGSRCGDLERLFKEELHSSFAALEHKSSEIRETTKGLAIRMGEVEQNLASHTHEFAHTKTYKSSPPTSSPTAGSEMCGVHCR